MRLGRRLLRWSGGEPAVKIETAALGLILLTPILREYLPLFAAAGAGLAATQRLPVRFSQLKGYAMAAVKPFAGPERRKTGRRDEDQAPLARIKALEETAQAQGKSLTKALKKIDRHIVGCESSAIKNEADNAKIIKMQGEQTDVLTAQTKQLDLIQDTQSQLQELLPWLRKQYTSSKGWSDFWHAASKFVWGMVQKNWEAVSGKILLILVIAVLGVKTGHEIGWDSILKWVFG